MRRFALLLIVLTLLVAAFPPAPIQVIAAGNACDGDPDGKGCLDLMAANPTPAVNPVDVDRREVGSYAFFKVADSAPLFDAPAGNQIGTYPAGFNFVVVVTQKDGYAQLRDKRWVKRTDLKQTYASTYRGVTFKDLPYPMAWVIQAVLPSATPGASNKGAAKAIPRYTMLYLYATVRVGQWDWFLVGPGQWVEQRKLARMIPANVPEGSTAKWVNVNLYEQVLTAYEGNRPVFATLVSSGLPDFQTRPGVFKVWSRHNSTPMSGAMGRPDFYSLPAVPYVMFFDDDISLHGTYWHDGFGFKHSHGCVNMSITDAKWVFDWTKDADLTVNAISGK